ncbi:MAG: hypothetical protein GY939_06020 [Actinomycetia bacterium]|nr:hypothetical protein [Actinomycetes bacterium]
MNDPLAGRVTIPGFPIKFSDAPPEPDLATHALGQDNEAVLGDMLGYDEATIAALTAEGIIVSKQH